MNLIQEITDSAHHAMSNNLTIALVAGEMSGDTLGANLLQALKSRYPHARFIGIGGPKMIAEGMQSWYPMERLSVMGFFEVLKRLRELLVLRKQLIQRLIVEKPDVFIGIDAPDFNFTVEKKLKAHGITTVHYVGPSVWAWREKRLAKIKQAVDGVLVLFPFEPAYYHRYAIPVAFVGHPLAQQVPEIPDKARARTQLGFAVDLPLTAILPGSRMSEINQMTTPYLLAAAQVSHTCPRMHFVIPVVHQTAMAAIQQAIEILLKTEEISAEFVAKLHLLDGQAQLALEACDQALVTSGTATLECALMRRPLILAIKVHPLSYWIMSKLATTQWIGLPNILANRSIVPELIQAQATAPKIAQSLLALIDSVPLRQQQCSAFEIQYQQLKQPSADLAVEALRKWSRLDAVR
ncbi:lipid-A-disaccharide synthase [Thiosulfatimonas sediminis]|uniref:Lipid-A-disaccharide synthase n=1 Tax=Thiosulfatimonas sediminis TaxID=2675054 RepID=A0A6F8PV68_9GAMM|nr:lipid-A-disaccharide synthase [Thiosulfatimonas sediminis]BBP45904.1 lipid-A-disaccharide synthase [Thiosulfatimonas sediminis]